MTMLLLSSVSSVGSSCLMVSSLVMVSSVVHGVFEFVVVRLVSMWCGGLWVMVWLFISMSNRLRCWYDFCRSIQDY